jgi:hypothetical protein
MTDFSVLLAELGMPVQPRRAPPQAARHRAPAPVDDLRPLPSSRPDAAFAKAMAAATEDVAEAILDGWKPGVGCGINGMGHGFVVTGVSLDGKRIEVMQAPDPANSAAGVNFVSPRVWVAASVAYRVPQFDAPGADSLTFAQAQEIAARQQGNAAKLGDIRDRARGKVAATRTQILADMHAGKITGTEAIEKDIILGVGRRFVRKCTLAACSKSRCLRG